MKPDHDTFEKTLYRHLGLFGRLRQPARGVPRAHSRTAPSACGDAAEQDGGRRARRALSATGGAWVCPSPPRRRSSCSSRRVTGPARTRWRASTPQTARCTRSPGTRGRCCVRAIRSTPTRSSARMAAPAPCSRWRTARASRCGRSPSSRSSARTTACRIRLGTGGIIVNAAKQRSGHLYVQTKDMTVSVVGTVFLVNAEDDGSRVAVIEGEVRVHEGTHRDDVAAGEQVSTNPAVGARPVAEEIAWSRQADAYRAILDDLCQGHGADGRSPRAFDQCVRSVTAAFDQGAATAAQGQPATGQPAARPQFEEASIRHVRSGQHP